jgi:hypothetical protein
MGRSPSVRRLESTIPLCRQGIALCDPPDRQALLAVFRTQNIELQSARIAPGSAKVIQNCHRKIREANILLADSPKLQSRQNGPSW